MTIIRERQIWKCGEMKGGGCYSPCSDCCRGVTAYTEEWAWAERITFCAMKYICGLRRSKTTTRCPESWYWTLAWTVQRQVFAFGDNGKGEARDYNSAWKTQGGVWSQRGFLKLSIREEYSKPHLVLCLYRTQLMSTVCLYCACHNLNLMCILSPILTHMWLLVLFST